MMRAMLERVIKGDPRHRSRLHDFEGNRIPLAELLRLPRSVVSTVLRKFGRRASIPWLSYRVANRLKEILTPDSVVLEFGSGSSTLWLQERCGLLVTIENDKEWFEWVRERINGKVDARLRESMRDYLKVEDYPDRFFDLVIVDGRWRDASMVKALQMVKPGGYVYLDNSDVQDREHQEAKRLLLASCPRAEVLIGFTPFQVETTQGLLGRLPRQ